jgi:hypothetical protein
MGSGASYRARPLARYDARVPTAKRIHLRSARLRLRDCRTRQPFRFGIHTLTVAPLVILEADVEVEGCGIARGQSSDLLVPKWFEKDPAKSPRDDVLALIASARDAIAVASELPEACAFDTVFDLLTRRYAANSAPPLLLGFGVSLVERALLDALCRALDLPFATVIRDDHVAFRPERLDPTTAGWSAARALPQAAAPNVILRHTVGLLDLLAPDSETAPAPSDGEPVTLLEAARRQGLEHFKIKFCGDPDRDRNRLLAIAGILDLAAKPTWRFTLDGNEQYTDLATLADLLDELSRTRRGKDVLARLLYTEQPLPRATSFDSDAVRGIDRFDRFGGLIFDEADAGPGVFPRALDLGYRGVSMKNCKGVFRALTHRARIDTARRGFQSGEDLTNLPILALQQDLATAALLGLTSIERNGHHYFRGLDHLAASAREAALAAHSDLYERRDGGVFLRIENGRLSLRSVVANGYGTKLFDLADGFVDAAEWTPPADLGGAS